MKRLFIFFAGAFSANSVPHFVNGISGREAQAPFLYRFFTGIPNPFFNVIWGLIFAALSLFFLNLYTKPGRITDVFRNKPGNFILFSLGFIGVSVFLSLFFQNGGWS